MRVIYRPNNRSTSQPSNPAAASGRAEGDGGAGGIEVRLGDGRYTPTAGTGANGTGPCAAGCGPALLCDAVWYKVEMKPPLCVICNPATGPASRAARVRPVPPSNGRT